jgi:8-oxo-dGTP pyrophosphatase MutT (NUDIX family)
MRQIVSELRNVPYAPKPNAATFVVATDMPPSSLITSAFAFVFSVLGVLLVNEGRDWDIPGGHIEPGEEPEETMRREVLEETGVVVRALGLIGYQHIHLEEQAPAGYRYPAPDSYQVFFLAEPISGSIGGEPGRDPSALFWKIDDVRRSAWVRRHSAFFEAAYAHWRTLNAVGRGA